MLLTHVFTEGVMQMLSQVGLYTGFKHLNRLLHISPVDERTDLLCVSQKIHPGRKGHLW